MPKPRGWGTGKATTQAAPLRPEPELWSPVWHSVTCLRCPSRGVMLQAMPVPRAVSRLMKRWLWTVFRESRHLPRAVPGKDGCPSRTWRQLGLRQEPRTQLWGPPQSNFGILMMEEKSLPKIDENVTEQRSGGTLVSAQHYTVQTGPPEAWGDPFPEDLCRVGQGEDTLLHAANMTHWVATGR